MTEFMVIRANTSEEFETGARLFREYAASLDFDLGYQDFDEELRSIGLQYAQPHGALLLCMAVDNRAAGCAGVRRLSEGIAELKRLYVSPAFRKNGLGLRLLEAAVETAGLLGYRFIRLDTVRGQEKAQDLYRLAGFYEIEPYRYSPVEGTLYFEKSLKAPFPD